MAVTPNAWSAWEVSAAIAGAPDGQATVSYLREATGKPVKTIENLLVTLRTAGHVQSTVLTTGGRKSKDRAQYELLPRGDRVNGFNARKARHVLGVLGDRSELGGEGLPSPREAVARSLVSSAPHARVLAELRRAQQPVLIAELTRVSGMTEDSLRKHLRKLGDVADRVGEGESAAGVVETVSLFESGRMTEGMSPKTKTFRLTEQGVADTDAAFDYLEHLTSAVEARAERLQAERQAAIEQQGRHQGPGGRGMRAFILGDDGLGL